MKSRIQECIDECEGALTHLIKALPMAHGEAKQKCSMLLKI